MHQSIIERLELIQIDFISIPGISQPIFSYSRIANVYFAVNEDNPETHLVIKCRPQKEGVAVPVSIDEVSVKLLEGCNTGILYECFKSMLSV